MKILLRPRLCSPALAGDLASDPALGKALGAEPNAAVGFIFKRFVDAAGPHLPRMLELARLHGESLSFLRDMQFTAAELAGASHLEVLCRRTIAQTRPDIERTRGAYAQEALQPSPSRWPLRLPQRVYLTKAPPSGTIAHVDQWTGEYVCGAEAAASLRAAGFSGAVLRPVLHPRGDVAQEGMGHLATTALLPPALEDVTTFETFDDGPREPSQPRRYGLLSYGSDALAGSTDFARTAEPWGDWRTPTWVVRQAVRRWFDAGGFRGWAFQPVLHAGTALHTAHEREWGRVLAVLRDGGAEVMA